MTDNSGKTALFKEAVMRQVNAEAESMIAQANKKAEEMIRAAESENEKKLKDALQKKEKEVRSKRQKEVSLSSFSSSREITAKRNELVEELFSGIYERLLGYSRSNDYKEQFAEDTEKVNSAKTFYKDVTAYVKPDDIKFAEKFFKKKYIGVLVAADKNIKLGGVTFFYPNDNTYIDKTLDGAFAAEKEAFVNNADIKLPE